MTRRATGPATPRIGRPVGARSPRAASDASDLARDRAVLLNQILLTAVVFIVAGLAVVGSFAGDAALFFLGVVLVFAVAGATLLVPWNRLHPVWVALVPALDGVAITLMQFAAPGTTLGLLWVFPATWLAASFGLVGLWSVIAAMLGVNVLVFLSTGDPLGAMTILVPVVLVAVAVGSHVAASRSTAQRNLLVKQSDLLRRLLETTRLQEQTVTEVLDAVDFGVIRVGRDGRVAVTNDAHARLQRAVGGEGTAPAFRDDGVTPLPDDERPLERALRGEGFDDAVAWFGSDPATRRALSITARRLVDDTGADAGVVVVSRDVTTELLALRARDELVASVSHELRTPLTSIIGYLDLAIDAPATPADVRRDLQVAERNAERLLLIVGDILAASSTAASAATSVEPRVVAVQDIVAASAQALRPRADARGVLVHLDEVRPATGWADPDRLRQVVDNLVANAVTYNREGGHVHLATAMDAGWTRIVVRDTGQGMSEDECARLFQRYYRAGAQVTGTGLGLAISRDIVRQLGGEITVTSAVGVGSTFVVKVPEAEPSERLS